MSLLCFGISHQTAPLSVLEPLSFTAPQMAELLAGLCGGKVKEAAGLSTCNRTEFYLEADDAEAAREELLAALQRKTHVNLSLQLEHSYTRKEMEAARHLFRVACGIDSLIVGEQQIMGQIRAALETAQQSGTGGRILRNLFNKALSTGRRAHLETGIGHGHVSVASVAVSIAEKVFTDLSKKSVLVIGAGQTAKIAAMQLKKAGVGRTTVVNRTHARAEELAEMLGGSTASFDSLAEQLERADIVVCATGSQEPLVTADMMKRRRCAAPLIMLDLSLPRNIEPAAGKLDFVFLYGIEDLEAAARENRAQRETEIAAVEAIISEEIGKFSRWYARGEADLLIIALRRRIEEIRQHHLERYANSESPQTRAQIDKFSDSLLRTVLHDLTENLRNIDLESEAGRRELELACRLFSIDPASVTNLS